MYVSVVRAPNTRRALALTMALALGAAAMSGCSKPASTGTPTVSAATPRPGSPRQVATTLEGGALTVRWADPATMVSPTVSGYQVTLDGSVIATVSVSVHEYVMTHIPSGTHTVTVASVSGGTSSEGISGSIVITPTPSTSPSPKPSTSARPSPKPSPTPTHTSSAPTPSKTSAPPAIVITHAQFLIRSAEFLGSEVRDQPQDAPWPFNGWWFAVGWAPSPGQAGYVASKAGLTRSQAVSFAAKFTTDQRTAGGDQVGKAVMYGGAWFVVIYLRCTADPRCEPAY